MASVLIDVFYVLFIFSRDADMCDELTWRISGCSASESTGKSVAQDNSETVVTPTELSTTNKTSETNEKVQKNLLHDHEQKFANLPYHLRLTRLCSNVGITKIVTTKQHFTTLDNAELEKFGSSCREFSLPRDDKSSKMKGWIRGNTKTVQLWRWQSAIIKDITESRS